MGVSVPDYSTYSFRRGGLSILADGEMHPSYIQNSAWHKCWAYSVTYIKPSLSKALQANNLLSGNNPEEGWGSRYSGNPRSLAPFLPKQSIKSSPSSIQVFQHRRPSVIMSTNSYTEANFVVEDSSSKKRSLVCDQTESCSYKVRVRDNIFFSSKPNFLDQGFY